MAKESGKVGKSIPLLVQAFIVGGRQVRNRLAVKGSQPLLKFAEIIPGGLDEVVEVGNFGHHGSVKVEVRSSGSTGRSVLLVPNLAE